MSKRIIIVALMALTSVANSSTNYNPDEVFLSIYQSFFDSLQLHYEVPAGCAGNYATGSNYGGSTSKQDCALAADFNGDGNPDYAALREFIGAGSRSGGRYLDLIVLYSSNFQGEAQHQVFTHMGSVDSQGVVDTFLSIQPTGEIVLPNGVKNLDKPGVNLLRVFESNDDPWAFPTIYWDERVQTFYSLTKEDE